MYHRVCENLIAFFRHDVPESPSKPAYYSLPVHGIFQHADGYKGMRVILLRDHLIHQSKQHRKILAVVQQVIESFLKRVDFRPRFII